MKTRDCPFGRSRVFIGLKIHFSALIKSALFESDEGDDDGADVEAFADYTADGQVVHVMYYPKRGDDRDLCHADGLSVS